MAKVTDLTPDDKNFNAGSEYGKHLLDKSIGQFGAGRSILIDKNNRVISGNKTLEAFAESGLENVQIIDSDGTTLVAVRRNDIDLDSQQGRELALADNQVQKINFVLAEEVLAETLTAEVCEAWGVKPETDYSLKNKEIDTDFDGQKYTFKLEYSEEEYTELKSKIERIGKTPEAIFYDALV